MRNALIRILNACNVAFDIVKRDKFSDLSQCMSRSNQHAEKRKTMKSFPRCKLLRMSQQLMSNSVVHRYENFTNIQGVNLAETEIHK